MIAGWQTDFELERFHDSDSYVTGFFNTAFEIIPVQRLNYKSVHTVE